MPNDDIKKIHENKLKIQRLKEAEDILQKIKRYLPSIEIFSMNKIDHLEQLNQEINKQRNFTEKAGQYTILEHELNQEIETLQAASLANEIIATNYNEEQHSQHPELAKVINKIKSILATKDKLDHLKQSIEKVKTQLDDLDGLHNVYKRTNQLIDDLSIFKKDFYVIFNQDLVILENKIISFTKTIDDIIKSMTMLDNKLGTHDYTIKQLEEAKEKLKSLPDKLSYLTKYCDKEIISPAIDSIKKVASAIECFINSTDAKLEALRAYIKDNQKLEWSFPSADPPTYKNPYGLHELTSKDMYVHFSLPLLARLNTPKGTATLIGRDPTSKVLLFLIDNEKGIRDLYGVKDVNSMKKSGIVLLDEDDQFLHPILSNAFDKFQRVTDQTNQKVRQKIERESIFMQVSPNSHSQNLNIMNLDNLKEIFSLLDEPDLFHLRVVSKKFQAIADAIITKPENIIKIIAKMDIDKVFAFVEYYQSTELYKILQERYRNDKENRMTSIEIICHALTTTNIYEIVPEKLEAALKNFNEYPYLLRKLEITLQIVKRHKYTGKDREKSIDEYYERLLKQNNYLNLAGIELTDLCNVNNNISASQELSRYFYYANLINANLAGLPRNTNFYHVNLKGANLSNTEFSGLEFVNTDLAGCDLSNANLKNFVIGGFNLLWTKLKNTNLRDAKKVEEVILLPSNILQVGTGDKVKKLFNLLESVVHGQIGDNAAKLRLYKALEKNVIDIIKFECGTHNFNLASEFAKTACKYFLDLYKEQGFSGRMFIKNLQPDLLIIFQKDIEDLKRIFANNVSIQTDMTDLLSLPLEIMLKVLANLPPKKLAQISRVSKSFYENLINVSFWKDNLIKAGCDRDLINYVINLNVIKNYKNLYEVVSILKDKMEITEPWELLCLSGEEDALRYAVDHERLDKTNKNNFRMNALHLTTLSGNAKAMKFALDLGIDKNEKCQHLSASSNIAKINIIDLAVLSVKLDALRFASYLLLSPDAKLKKPKELQDTWNEFYLKAAYYGNSDAMAYALTMGADPNYKDKNHANAVFIAASKNNVIAMKYAAKMGTNIHDINNEGANPLHVAAFEGNVEAMEQAVRLGIQPTSRDSNGDNALHYAATTGQVNTMQCAVIDLGIKEDSKNANGENALHLAAMKGHVAAVRYALELGINPKSTNKDGLNALQLTIKCCAPNRKAIVEALEAFENKISPSDKQNVPRV